MKKFWYAFFDDIVGGTMICKRFFEAEDEKDADKQSYEYAQKHNLFRLPIHKDYVDMLEEIRCELCPIHDEKKLCFLIDLDSGDYDYLFLIDKSELEKAVDYVKNKRMNGEDEYTSDIELITEYLDKKGIVYKMFSLFDANKLYY